MNKEIDKKTGKADSLFLIVVGSKTSMENLMKNIQKDNEKDRYTLTKISYPSAHKSLDLMKELNGVTDDSLLNSITQKPVRVEDGIECAQCYTYAEGNYDPNSYMLQQVTDNGDYYTLTFPKFPLGEDESYESVVEDWFRKNIKNAQYSNNVKKNTKLITIVGANLNILVITTDYVSR